nr:hypothetical protein [Pseudomonas helleri]
MDLYLGAFVGFLAHLVAIQYGEFGTTDLDHNDLIGLGDNIALEGLRVHTDAERGFLRKVFVDTELEAANIARNMGRHQRWYLRANG